MEGVLLQPRKRVLLSRDLRASILTYGCYTELPILKLLTVGMLHNATVEAKVREASRQWISRKKMTTGREVQNQNCGAGCLIIFFPSLKIILADDMWEDDIMRDFLHGPRLRERSTKSLHILNHRFKKTTTGSMR